MNWHQRLTDQVDIFALQAPGREERIQESAIGCTDQLSTIIAEEIQEFLDKPFVFLGHSNGTILAYEVARKLRRNLNRLPIHFILSGTRAAHLPKPKKICHLPENELIQAIKGFQGTPESLLENKKFMKLILPLLRADFAIADRYQFCPGKKLNASLSLFWATGESEVSKAETLAWKDLIEGQLDYVEFSGEHLFIKDQEDEYIHHCNLILKRLLKDKSLPVIQKQLVSN